MPKRKRTITPRTEPLPDAGPASYAEQIRTLRAGRKSLVPQKDKQEQERIKWHNEIAATEKAYYDKLMARPRSQGNEDLWAKIDEIKKTVPDFDPTKPRDPIVSLGASDFHDMAGEEGDYETEDES